MIISHLRELLFERRTNVNQVSIATGIHRTRLHDLYHGRTAAIKIATLDRLCKHLGVELGQLLEYREDAA